jgi:Cu(I)/Ag(I) efflux system membrane fusion protein
MPLSKRNKGEVSELPEGVLTRVQLSPERVQLAGVETVAASYMPLSKEVRTVGYVQYDEARLAEIVTRVDGYLEKLFIDKTFAQVDEGQPLAEIYSPALYSSIQELRLAKKHGATDLVASARQRLKLLGVDDAELDEALKAGDAEARLLIRSPQSGQVIEKNVVQGASVEAGAVLFKVADLSTVWIEADVYERDLPFLHEGQDIEAVVDALPGRKFSGEIALIYPELNARTRTNRVRIAIDNPELLLRPGMFATVKIRTPMSETEPFKTAIAEAHQRPEAMDDEALAAFQKICPVTGKKLGSMGDPLKVSVNGQPVFICCAGCKEPLLAHPNHYLAKLAPPPAGVVLSVPEQSVIDTGTQQVVYVEREPGLFEGVEVELGTRAGGFYPVISGLAAGDKIAAAGSFLLDAETRLNPAAASAYFGASGHNDVSSAAAGSSATRSTAQKSEKLSAAQLAQIDKLPVEDRKLAIAQAVCPVTDEPLGSMGPPVKVTVEGEPVFLCCQGCERDVRENPQQILTKVRKLRGDGQPSSAVPPENRPADHQHSP